MAIVAFLVLIAVVQLFGAGGGGNTLSDRFADGRTVPGLAPGLSLPPLPTSISELARTAVARLAGGQQAPALTPVAQNETLRVEITRLTPTEQGLRITGEVSNIGKDAMVVSLSQFHFIDEQGTKYATENGAGTTLGPGQRAPLDLTLPLTQPRQLSLEVEVPGQPLLTMTLVQSQ